MTIVVECTLKSFNEIWIDPNEMEHQIQAGIIAFIEKLEDINLRKHLVKQDLVKAPCEKAANERRTRENTNIRERQVFN